MDSDSDAGKAGLGTRISSGWNAFLMFLYNPAEKTVFGRGGKSWGKERKIQFFYYPVLVLFA